MIIFSRTCCWRVGLGLLLVTFLLPQAPARAVEIAQVQYRGKTLTVCRVNVLHEHLELFLRDENGRTLKRFDRVAEMVQRRGHKLVFALNAGMYHPDYSPVGLFISEGHQLGALNTGDAYGNFFLKPNGVFLLTKTGARVVETSAFPAIMEPVQLATQSGPMLVHQGKIHSALQPKSDSLLFRNGVCAPTPEIAIFVNSEAPLNLYEFASYFRDELKSDEALFLDGTVCSLYSTELKRNDYRIDLGPIIGVTE